jgi:hypothetical protein
VGGVGLFGDVLFDIVAIDQCREERSEKIYLVSIRIRGEN